MILTITLNPSIDISYPLKKFEIDTVNRIANPIKTAGGKGLNVTRVLHQLGDKVVASGLLGGKLGEFLETELGNSSIEHSFFHIEGETRNCIAILHEGNQTEILEQGPNISNKEANGFLDYFRNLISDFTLVSISGSLPSGLSSDYYVQMLSICEEKNIPVVLDCSGTPLQEVLTASKKPKVIKPNTEELSQLLGVEVTNDINQLKSTLQSKLFDGIEWVIVSMGSKGAFAKHWNKFYKVSIPKIEVKNPVGSGDSTVAGIASAIVEDLNDVELLKKANVLGMLNAQEKLTGYVNLANYEKLASQIQVEEV